MFLLSRIIFIKMQQFSESKYFPKKLQKLTHRVAKLLSQKYTLQDDENIKDPIRYPQQETKRQIELKSDDVAFAFEKSQRMNNKLKLIRTMLGYEYESKQKIQHQTIRQHSITKFIDEKGTNLKQFVISMRKRNQILEKYFKNRNNSPQKTMMSFGPQSKNVQEYTDASLKYVHSFLPHHSTIQYSPSKIKKTYQNSPTPKLLKHQIIAQNNIASFEINHQSQQQKFPTELNHKAYAQQSQSPFQSNHLPSKHSHQLPQTKRSLYQTIDTKRSTSMANEKDNRSNAFLPGALHEKNTVDQQKYLRNDQMKSRATSFQVYTNRITESIYKGKNHTKQVINSFKINKKDDKNGTSLSKDKKQSRQILPTINPYEPKIRPKKSKGKTNP